MKPSYAFSEDFYPEGSPGAAGRCTWHRSGADDAASCTGEAVVSFEDDRGQWQAGCSAALEQLVERHQIEPLGQGA
jgi:hypothetical protein